MPVSRLHHVNIPTLNLPASIAFYGDVLGLRVGPAAGRTDMDGGAWGFDANGVPIVHLVGTSRHNAGPEPERGVAARGMIDHFALSCTGKAEMLHRLAAHHVTFQPLALPDMGLDLLFVRDPNGVMVELSFPPEE